MMAYAARRAVYDRPPGSTASLRARVLRAQHRGRVRRGISNAACLLQTFLPVENANTALNRGGVCNLDG
jgi:hypothetical protein